MTIAVVVATHDRPRRLELLLDALRAQRRRPDEVVIVDDGSDPRTATVLERELARESLPLRVLRHERPAGPAAARDLGWRATTAELIAFTDDDCAPSPEWLAQLQAARDGPDRFLQGPTLPNPAELTALGPFSRTIWVRQLDLAFPTCNVAYPRALLERVGGFDTVAFGREPGGEDCDLAWRAIDAGARPAFVDGALVHHAVERVGAIGKLRVAARWSRPMTAYARHPRLRRATFSHGIFWKQIHWLWFRALIGLLLPNRLHPLRNWLAYPYLRDVWARGRREGGGPLLAPYFVLHDVIEIAAVARGAIANRTPML